MFSAPSKEKPLTGELTAAQARPDHVADLLMAIIDGFSLSDFEREQVLQKLNERNLVISTPRAGTTLAAVVEFVKHQKPAATFTLDDVRAALDNGGIKVSPKEIYNALGYLTRKDHVGRIGYGQYRTADLGRKEA